MSDVAQAAPEAGAGAAFGAGRIAARGILVVAAAAR